MDTLAVICMLLQEGRTAKISQGFEARSTEGLTWEIVVFSVLGIVLLLAVMGLW